MNIIQDQSPNKTIGRAGKTISTIVLHSTYGSYWGSVAWLKNPTAKVSSHYIISREGEIRKLVSEANTAWHAGNLSVNQESIGIETADDKSKDITQKAKDALIWLVADIKKRYTIQSIKFHREIVSTACPYLNIDKAWFVALDPLTECLRQHTELVSEVNELKIKLDQQKLDFEATEKRLVAEKDGIVREKDAVIVGLNNKLKVQQVQIDGFQSEIVSKKSEWALECQNEKKELVNKISEYSKTLIT